MIMRNSCVNYHYTVRHSVHDPIPLRENQNRKGKWRQAKSTTTRSCRTTEQGAQGAASGNTALTREWTTSGF